MGLLLGLMYGVSVRSTVCGHFKAYCMGLL